MITVNFSRSKISDEEIKKYSKNVVDVDKKLEKMAKKDDQMAGFVFWPENYDKKEFKKIQKAAEKIRKTSDVLLVIGIGGSFLGAKAVCELLKKDTGVEVIFVGNNMSTRYINRVIKYIEDKEFSINVISKSGTTTEPAIAFRIFENLIIQKYGVTESKKRIYITTDKENGTLVTIAKQEGYERFVIPRNIGGRYSVLTPVGLLPIASCGADISKLLDGAKHAMNEYLDEDVSKNSCYMFALHRYIYNVVYEKDIEIVASFEPCFLDYIEWIKQLYNESEGKGSSAMFTTGAIMTTDLHSIGQNIQEGKRNIIESVINVSDMNEPDIVINNSEENLDNLNYLEGYSVDYINKTAMEATINAHLEGDVPNVLITIDKLDEYNIGELIYFYEKSCAIYCMLLGVDPFNQPGVEKYKNNMFRMLGKPGY